MLKFHIGQEVWNEFFRKSLLLLVQYPGDIIVQTSLVFMSITVCHVHNLIYYYYITTQTSLINIAIQYYKNKMTMS